jgi:MFS superfamily sulfate permease-like transporter
VVGLGVVITIAGGMALYNHGIVADQTGVSGWNPALWVVILAGIATALLGLVQFGFAMSDDSRIPPLDA